MGRLGHRSFGLAENVYELRNSIVPSEAPVTDNGSGRRVCSRRELRVPEDPSASAGHGFSEG